MSAHGGSDTLLGTEVAGYRIEALIGRGGMGAVYRAEDAKLQRKTALKVIAPELAENKRFRDRFLRESQIAASLDHPHIVPIYQAGEEDGVLFLAMRYVEGTDLARLIADEGSLEPRRALALVEQVAEALDAAHERGLVHRDVKPSNVLIASSAGREHCYLADFGLTKRTGSLSGVTAAGEVVGTLEYVAPEQITGDSLDERSDVYSLGCVLYECLTGQPPFAKATDVALLWAHVHEEPQPPSTLRVELPKELDAIIARALAKDPGRRYRSAGELAAAAGSALALADAPPTRRLSPWLLPAAAAGLAVAAIAVTLVLSLGSDSGGLTAISANAVGVIDPATNELVAEVPVGIRPGPVAVSEGAVWVANLDDETVSRIDPETREVVRTVPTGGFPVDVAAGGDSVWVFVSDILNPIGLTEITPAFTNAERLPLRNEAGLECGAQLARLAVGGGSAWITCDNNVVFRINLRTGTVQPATIDTGGAFIQEEYYDIVTGLGSAWIVNRATNSLVEIDTKTNVGLAATAVTIGRNPVAVAVGASSIWVANREDDTVSRVEPSLGQAPVVTSIPVGDGPVDVAYGEGAVWVANSLDGTVSRIDPETNEVVATVHVGESPQRIAAGGGAVWVTLLGLDTEATG